MSNDLASLRQQLWRAYAALAHTLRRLQRSDPMVQGSFYLLRRKCGKPNCRCATGQLHAAYVLTRSEAAQAIFDFIESFYNRRRLHSSLEYLYDSDRGGRARKTA